MANINFTASGGSLPFDPLNQTFVLLGGDGQRKIPVHLAALDTHNRYAISTSINYGAQIGACIIMLVAVLTMTAPASKLTRPTTVVHLTALVVCILQLGFLANFFLTNFTEVYIQFSSDFSRVPYRDQQCSVAGNNLSAILLILVEAALILQAWAMVKIWPRVWKWLAIVLSLLVALAMVALRIASTVILNMAVLTFRSQMQYRWLAGTNVILTVMSVCWFCALFNIPLTMHLIKNRGVLPHRGGMTPMEVLIYTNGILMIIPVIFAGLQWGRFQRFEPGSLVATSVVVILPLGTLIAQRMAAPASRFLSSGNTNGTERSSPNSSTPFRTDFSGMHRIHSATHGSRAIVSRIEAGRLPSKDSSMHPLERQLEKIDNEDDYCKTIPQHHVVVNREFDRREERV